jgi:hypothetical protein
MSLSAPASDKVTLTLWPKHILRIIIRITYRRFALVARFALRGVAPTRARRGASKLVPSACYMNVVPVADGPRGRVPGQEA